MRAVQIYRNTPATPFCHTKYHSKYIRSIYATHSKFRRDVLSHRFFSFTPLLPHFSQGVLHSALFGAVPSHVFFRCEKFFISTAFIIILLMQVKVMITIHTFISECYNRAMYNVFNPLLKNAAANVKTGPSVLNHVFQVTYAFCPSSFHLLHYWIQSSKIMNLLILVPLVSAISHLFVGLAG